ncbi:MAG TPA: DUF1015 domain-containing protein [Acidobacteriaceae bacterium]|nr:DUF1015 domain-containing protein [Acidobacteriaceae bacterium]
MATIYPFRALRYNPSFVRLEDVVTQPYDKISPAMQQAYYQRSPYNLVRIILGLPELFDDENNNVYTRAARDFQAWRESGIMAAEYEPALFAYAQRYTVPGSSDVRERRGFIALGQLEDYGRGIVFRHEQTLAKPKSDRLNLLRATRAHFGQIFMLYSDPAHTAERVLFTDSSLPDAMVTDDYGVEHRIWKIDDAPTINLIASSMQDKKLIIADGHHRYETALAYSREHAPAGSTPRPHGVYQEPEYPEAAVMMTFVNMESEGMTILPTHRVVFGLHGFDEERFLVGAREFFTVEKLEQRDPSQLMKLLAKAGVEATAFVAVMRNSTFLLVAREDTVNAALASQPARQRQLDIVRLHSLVLERLLGISPEAIRDQKNLRYLREAAEAIEQVSSGEADVAFLTNPVSLPELRDVAFAGEVMPQKSTDFYPKLLSGLTVYALE